MRHAQFFRSADSSSESRIRAQSNVDQVNKVSSPRKSICANKNCRPISGECARRSEDPGAKVPGTISSFSAVRSISNLRKSFGVQLSTADAAKSKPLPFSPSRKATSSGKPRKSGSRCQLGACVTQRRIVHPVSRPVPAAVRSGVENHATTRTSRRAGDELKSRSCQFNVVEVFFAKKCIFRTRRLKRQK